VVLRQVFEKQGLTRKVFISQRLRRFFEKIGDIFEENWQAGVIESRSFKSRSLKSRTMKSGTMKSQSGKGRSKRGSAKTGTRRGRRKRDLAALEKRRMRGVRLLREGVWQSEVARRLGVHRQSVSRWAEKLKRGGERALGAGRVGRPARLHPEDLKRLERVLKRGPAADRRLGKRPRKWTAKQVAELIERECRVKYDVSQAWRILRGLGWRRARAGGGWRMTQAGQRRG